MSYGSWQVGAGFDASEGLLLVEEVARLYRVDPRTVLAWVGAGRMPAVAFLRTPGREYRFSKRWVRDHLELTMEQFGPTLEASGG